MTAAAGFLLAARGHINLPLLVATIVGMALVIGSACVFNNYIDRDIDIKMARTKSRALVSGSISGRAALIYATTLGLVGAIILARFTNWLVLVIGLIAFVDYVVVYGYSKRRSVHSTLIGSVSGAAPIVAGYCAVTGRFDLGALILFLILTAWQMPHFYAIGIYRQSDYAAAGLPILPVKVGIAATKRQILVYTLLFVLATLSLTAFGYAGYTYALVMGVVGALWLRRATKPTTDDVKWARGLFGFSLIALLSFSSMISLTSVLP